MARLPRKPKLLKYPKKPRASSSASVLDRYLERVKDVDRRNQERLHSYEKEMREHEADKRRHRDLIRKIAGIGRAEDARKRRHHSTHHRRKKAAIGKRHTKRSVPKRRTRRRR